MPILVIAHASSTCKKEGAQKSDVQLIHLVTQFILQCSEYMKTSSGCDRIKVIQRKPLRKGAWGEVSVVTFHDCVYMSALGL